MVTKVNVEREGWEAGLGEVVWGTSRAFLVKRNPAVEQEGTLAMEEDVEPIPLVGEDNGGWGDWPLGEQLESRWESLQVLLQAESRVGSRVAIKVCSSDV